MSGEVFPLSALVDAEELTLALVLSAVDPAIGGVLLRGEKGSAKSTAARGLATLLPGTAPFVELPLGATEERVVGSLDLKAALGGGDYRFQPGLLAAADGGVLYVDEVNLLADHLVDVLLDAASGGVNRVERDGVSHVHPSRFVLIGSMNPEEGELRPQLLDRFGLAVGVRSPKDPALRAEALRRRLAFDKDPAGFRAHWAETEQALADRVATTVAAPLAPGLEEDVARLCAAAGAEGLRADLTLCRAAAALAGWEASPVADATHVRRVAPLVLAHRRATPFERPLGTRTDLDDLLDDLLDERTGGQPQDRSPTSPDSGPPGDMGGGPGEQREGPGEQREGPGDRSTSSSTPAAGTGPEPAAPPHDDEAARGELPPRLLDGGRQDHGSAAGHRGVPVGGVERGRLIGARVPGPGAAGGVALAATVSAAATRWSRGGSERREVTADDLREPVLAQPTSSLVVLAVDTSGSMGTADRVDSARGAVLALLADAYQRRDRVALVTFCGQTAEVALRPTGSIEVARARLEAIGTGGTTPLAAGITTALAVAGAAGNAYRPQLVLVSDGRATWAADGQDPVLAARQAAAQVRRAGVASVVIDCERGRIRLGLAASLAEALGGRLVTAEGQVLSAAMLADIVRSSLAT